MITLPVGETGYQIRIILVAMHRSADQNAREPGVTAGSKDDKRSRLTVYFKV